MAEEPKEEVKEIQFESKSCFEVRAELASAKHMALKIMKELRANLFDNYELRATGRKNLRSAEEIAHLLTRWIIIDDIICTRE